MKVEDNVYMMEPYGFVDKGQEHMVCKLHRSIFGLKQASQSWNIHFDQKIKYLVIDKIRMNHVCIRSASEVWWYF